MTIRSRAASLSAVVAVVALTAAAAQSPPENTVGEVVEVREASVVAVPSGSGATVPSIEAVTVTVGGLPRQVTRIEKVLDGKRGDWRFLVYVDPTLAGARTRFLAALALGQRAESLAALGTVEVLEAEAAKPALEPSGSWQHIEAALLAHALEAKHRLARGTAAVERPGWEVFRQRLDLLLAALEARGAGGPRALFLPSDGLFSASGSEELARVGRRLAGAGWILVPMPWSEEPSEGSAARLSEFESWKQSAEGRDVSAGTRRYVIDFGRVFQRLAGGAAPRPDDGELEPQWVALQALAGPTSGRLAGRDGELRAALGDLARRWRVWFRTSWPGGDEPRALEVRLDGKRLDAPAWFFLPSVE